MTHHYLAPYRGTGTRTDPFAPPVDGEWHGIDLRPNASRPDGACILALPERQSISGAVYLGDTLDEASSTARRSISSRLGVTLDVERLRAALPELLLLHAGPARWNRLRATGRRLEVWLGELVWTQPLVAGGAAFTETFNKADGSLGPDLTWTQLAGTWAVSGNAASLSAAGSESYSRAEHDSATSDNYTQFVITAMSQLAGFPEVMAAARYSSSANTAYGFRRANYPTSDDAAGPRHQLRKVVAGSTTELGSQVNIAAWAAPETVKVTANGSTIKGFLAGAEVQSVTDTSIASGLRGGFYGYRGGGGITISIDDFVHDDIATGPLISVTVSRLISTHTG